MFPPHNNNLQRAIFSTLAYFDIFDFPLTKEEMYTYLHVSEKTSFAELEKALLTISSETKDNRILYLLPKREGLAERRIQNEEISERKIEKEKNLLRMLGFFPTIAFIGISGSLAMKNGDGESDIDIFIITLPHTIWLTRFFLWIVLQLFSKRRKRNTKGQDTICINMLLDRNTLAFPHDRHEIYTAHEIVQVVPVVNKYQTYELFLQKNTWVLDYLANSFQKKFLIESIPFWLKIMSFCLIPLETIVRFMQVMYMRQHKTIEQTTKTFIAFHPYNYRDTILKEYKKRIQA